MAEAAKYESSQAEDFNRWEAELAGCEVGVSQELAQRRVLTETDHIISGLCPDDSVEPEVLADVVKNLKTAVYEMSFPLGMTTTVHHVEYAIGPDQRRQRLVKWMGKNIVENTVAGSKFYSTPAGMRRGDVEIAEAHRSQDLIQAGIAQSMISPKMSATDGSAAMAKAEHVHVDDSIRVAVPIIGKNGEVVARKLQSLLVRDVPLEAWVAMLRDPNNIFGKSITVEGEASALAVMKTFSELDLPQQFLPEGPITLVAEVQKYIKDNEAYDSVGRQLEGFRNDQEVYDIQAELIAEEWLAFEIELAKSRRDGYANTSIQSFIVSMQERWDDEALAMFATRHRGDNYYVVDDQLAAMLERAKRKVLRDRAAILAGEETTMMQLSSSGGESLRDRAVILQMAYQDQMISEQEYLQQLAELDRDISNQGIKGGEGGCAGPDQANLRGPNGANGDGKASDSSDKRSDWEMGNNRKWKRGNCQIKLCPSPKPTEVGPCSVCKRCQAVFDQGGDPTKPGLAALLPDKALGDKSATTEILDPVTNDAEPVDKQLIAEVEATFADLDSVAIQAEEERRQSERAVQLENQQPTQTNQNLGQLALSG